MIALMLQRLAVLALALLCATAPAPAKKAPKKKCTLDPNRVIESMPESRAELMLATASGIVAAEWDEAAASVKLVRLDGTPFGAPAVTQPPLARGKLHAFVAGDGELMALVAGTAQPPAAGKRKPPATASVQLVRFDGSGNPKGATPVAGDLLAGGAAVVEVVPTSVGLVVAVAGGGKTLVRVVSPDGSVTEPTTIEGEARAAFALGADGVTNVAILRDDPEDAAEPGATIFVFDVAARAVGAPITVRGVVAGFAALEAGTLLVVVRDNLEAAILDRSGKLGKWRRWVKPKKGHWMNDSDVAIARSPGGDVFVQWSTQLGSGMGRDDTPFYSAAQVQPDGTLGPHPKKGTDAGNWPIAAVAVDDGLYIAAPLASVNPNINNVSVDRWICR